MRLRSALMLIAILPITAEAQLVSVGGEFQINAFTTGAQFGLSPQSVARSSSGSFIVVWSSEGQDGDSSGIFAQRFDGTGAAVGGEFQVNTFTTSFQYDAAVSTNASGDFVIVWSSGSQDGDGNGVFGQRFDSAGAPAGTEFAANTHTTGAQRIPAVAIQDDGSVLVVWVSGSPSSTGPDGDREGVFGRFFDDTGAAIGTEYQVNTFTTNRQRYPRVASPGGESFIVVWESVGQDDGTAGIFAQRYDSAAAVVGSEFQVDATGVYGPENDARPAIATASDASFVVTWQSDNVDGDDYGVLAQRFNALAQKLGTEFQVNTFTTNYQAAPSVAFGAGRGFVVTWFSAYQDGSYTGVFGQRFDHTGAALEPEFQVNTHTTGYQGYNSASMASDNSGNFVVVWASADQDGDAFGMFGQLYELSTATTVTTTTTSTTTTSTTTSTLATLCGSGPLPEGACRLNEAAKGQLQIKDKDGGVKDQLKWKWKKGAATATADFDDPVNGAASYVVCIYDASMESQPVLEAEVLPGGTCHGKPCWKATGTKGFRYKNKAGNAAGLTQVKLKAGEAGKAQVQIKGKGAVLATPAPPRALPVTVQLLINDGATTECWQTTFTQAPKNEPGTFKAKGP